jgi:hypothetical protein
MSRAECKRRVDHDLAQVVWIARVREQSIRNEACMGKGVPGLERSFVVFWWSEISIRARPLRYRRIIATIRGMDGVETPYPAARGSGISQ